MIGTILKAWRVHNKVSLRNAANSMGISHSTLHRVENDRPVDAETMLRLINWLFA